MPPESLERKIVQFRIFDSSANANTHAHAHKSMWRSAKQHLFIHRFSLQNPTDIAFLWCSVSLQSTNCTVLLVMRERGESFVQLLQLLARVALLESWFRGRGCAEEAGEGEEGKILGDLEESSHPWWQWQCND